MQKALGTTRSRNIDLIFVIFYGFVQNHIIIFQPNL